MKYTFLLLSLVFLFSCAEENPLLVNPPAKNETVKLRFINLASDNNARTLQLEDLKIENIAFANSSAAIQPSSDSAYLKILKNNATEFELSSQVKYLRNTNYSFVALSKKYCSDCAIDTIVTLRTTAAIPESPTQSLVKFLNAYPDSTHKYLLKWGCPSGDIFIPAQNYMQYNLNPAIVETGVTSLSLVKISNLNQSEETFINLYNFEISKKSQYVIILTKFDGKESLTLLDENEATTNSLIELPQINDRNTSIRVLNLSSETINVDKYGTSVPFAQNIAPQFIDKYQSLVVCESMKLDTLSVSYNNIESSRNFVSLKVNTNYTYLVFDSLNKKSAESLIIENEKASVLNGKSSIRVVNASNYQFPLTVALGARYEQKSNEFPFSYSSGTILSSKQNFGDISNSVKLSKGIIPINVFTATEPARLIYSTRAEIDENKNYLLVLTTDENGKIKVILIDENQENTAIQYLDEGIFVQVVNAIKGTENMKVSFDSQSGESPLLQNAEVNFTNSLATVIENKAQVININGVSYSINPEKDKRTSIVASSIGNQINIISNNFEPFYNPNNFQFRFVNASNIDLINVKRDTATTAVIEESVPINSYSSFTSESRERKITYYIFDGDNPNFINRISDIFFTLGKSYSVIFGGEASNSCIKEYDKTKPKEDPNCYFVIIQQEF